MAVDEPRHDGRPADVDPTVGDRRPGGRADPDDAALLDDDGGVAHDAQAVGGRDGCTENRCATVGSGAGDELADVRDEGRARAGTDGSGRHRRTAAMASVSIRPTSPERCDAVPHDVLAVDDGVGDVGRGRGVEHLRRRHPGGARAVEAHGDEVGELPGRR